MTGSHEVRGSIPLGSTKPRIGSTDGNVVPLAELSQLSGVGVIFYPFELLAAFCLSLPAILSLKA